MYAVIVSGGQQFKVKNGDTVQVEKIEKGIGEKVEFEQVLLLSNGKDIKIGAPYLEKTKVVGEIVEQGRHKKIHIIKFRRRKHSMKQQGHRQYYTAVRIVEVAGEKLAPTKAAAKPVATEKKVEAKAAPAKKAAAKAPAKKTTEKKAEAKPAAKKAAPKKTEAKAADKKPAAKKVPAKKTESKK